MGDIRDELLKAGLISERTARDISRARRAEGRQNAVAHPPVSEEKELLPPPLDDPVQDEGPGEIIRRGAVARAPGNRRFHFVDRSGKIPFLELGEETIRGLTNGALAIAEANGVSSDEFVVVTAETAGALAHRFPEAVRFWNRR